MKKNPIRNLSTIALLLVALIALPLVGCEEKGPMEKAGESMDEAIDDARDAADEIGDDIEDAADEVGDEVDDATDGGN